MTTLASQKPTFLLSASKLVLYSIIPALLEYNSGPVLIATTNTALKDIRVIRACNFEYSVLYAHGEDTIDEFIKKMYSKRIYVGLIHVSDPLFEQMLQYGNGSVWYSACRTGILNYIPRIIRHATMPTDILCFDNDKSLLEQAQKICAGTFVNIHKCVAHCICSKAEYDVNNGLIQLFGGTENYLYFPPDIKKIIPHLYQPRNSFSKHAQLRFSESTEEFSFYVNAKLIDINALHTVVCVMSYIKGSENGLSLSEIASMHFSNLLDEAIVQNLICTLHSQLFEKFLQPIATQLGEKKEIHAALASSFITYLFSSQEECVARGLDCRNESYTTKLNQHIALLKAANNQDILEIFNKFEKLF